MKKLLNTIYITTENASLKKDGENIVVENEDKIIGRVPLHMIDGIIVFGSILLTPALIGSCAQKGITISIFDRIGRFQARIEGPISGNVLLRRAQYKQSDAPDNIVKNILIGKIANQRAVLMRALRDYGDQYDYQSKQKLDFTTKRLAHNLAYINTHDIPVDNLRGIEGDSAQLYFGVFDLLIRSKSEKLHFTKRTRRPPLDPVNALLSFLYALLTHDCRSAAESVGLDPAVGFLHRDRPGRPSLALDLMEELRPVLVDRMVLSLVNRGQINENDFEYTESGAVNMSDDARKTVLTAWQERKREERLHPFINEKVQFGLLPYIQAKLMASHLRGDLDAYIPWLWK